MSRLRIRTADGREIDIDDESSPLECFCCGNCCIGYNALVNHEEASLMAEHLGISKDDFITRYVDVTQVGYLIRQEKRGCVFLVPEKNDSPELICSVYPVRPEPCSTWKAGWHQRECRTGLDKFRESD